VGAPRWRSRSSGGARSTASEQLTRYLELLNRDPLLAPVAGIFAAQEIKPQARVLAEDRGIRCVVVDYDKLRGIQRDELTLF
jgi:RecB family endonuclease NucS